MSDILFGGKELMVRLSAARWQGSPGAGLHLGAASELNINPPGDPPTPPPPPSSASHPLEEGGGGGGGTQV